MINNQVQPIHLIAQELNDKTLELAQYKVAYQQLNDEVEELRELKELVDSNVELKELVDKLKSKEEN